MYSVNLAKGYSDASFHSWPVRITILLLILRETFDEVIDHCTTITRSTVQINTSRFASILGICLSTWDAHHWKSLSLLSTATCHGHVLFDEIDGNQQQIMERYRFYREAKVKIIGRCFKLSGTSCQTLLVGNMRGTVLTFIRRYLTIMPRAGNYGSLLFSYPQRCVRTRYLVSLVWRVLRVWGKVQLPVFHLTKATYLSSSRLTTRLVMMSFCLVLIN